MHHVDRVLQQMVSVERKTVYEEMRHVEEWSGEAKKRGIVDIAVTL